MSLTKLKIGKNRYYDARELLPYCNKSTRRPREVLQYAKVPSKFTLFAKEKDGVWTSVKNQQKPPKQCYTLIRCKFADPWIATVEQKRSTKGASKSKSSKYPVAPPLLELSEAEKFRGPDGVFEIETRGQRHPDKCYFRVSDLETALEAKNLRSALKTDRYIEGGDYVRFQGTVENVYRTSKVDKGGNRSGILYFTYRGAVKYFFRSNSPHADPFCEWASKMLYVDQLGTKEQKIKKALGQGIPIADAIKAVGCGGEMTAVYLIELGRVGDLRETFEIDSEVPDTHILYKYGKTEDLHDRLKRHRGDYGKMKNVSMHLTFFAQVLREKLSAAEARIKSMFDLGQMRQVGSDSTDRKRIELATIDPKLLKTHIKQRYEDISLVCGGGALTETQKRLDALTRDYQHLEEMRERDQQAAVRESALKDRLIDAQSREIEKQEKSQSLLQKLIEKVLG